MVRNKQELNSLTSILKRNLTKTHAKITSVRAKDCFELGGQFRHLLETIAGETTHQDGMVVARNWQTCHRNIAVSNRFYLEDMATLGNVIERTIQGLKKRKDLRRLTHGAPSCESTNVAEHDCCLGDYIHTC